MGRRWRRPRPRRPEGSGIPRAICWAPIWDTRHSGTGLEHLLLHEGSADGVVLAFDEQGHPFRLAYLLTWDAAWRLGEAMRS